MESFSDLPQDILVEIMSWLPPKSLFRFKCVQKSWYTLITSLIKNSFFVAKHLKNSNKKTSVLFTCTKDKNKPQQGFLTIYNNEDNNSRDVLSYAIKYFEPEISRKYYNDRAKAFFTASSHCNGLICLRFSSIVVVCNPATREYKLLPYSFYEGDHVFGVGLGYDDIDKVYKVVKILGCFDALTAQVYTLGIDDSWREIKMPEGTDDYDLFCDESMCCKGVSYWLLYNMWTWEDIIYSFDMHDEEFHTILLPDKFRRSKNYVLDEDTSLTQLNESLALFYHPTDKYKTVSPIEMWVMYESSEGQKCGSKYLSIDPIGGIYRIPILFWKSDELLMIENKKGLVAYNILTKRMRRLHNKKLSDFVGFGYVKSLVSVIGNI